MEGWSNDQWYARLGRHDCIVDKWAWSRHTGTMDNGQNKGDISMKFNYLDFLQSTSQAARLATRIFWAFTLSRFVPRLVSRNKMNMARYVTVLGCGASI